MQLLRLLYDAIYAIKREIARFIWTIFPFFRKARTFRERGVGAWGARFGWVVRIAAFIGVLVLLWWLNVRFELGRLLGNAPPALRDFWLPILFVLVVAISWLGWWLWLLVTGTEESEFPDIDAAWTEAIRGLYQGGIDPTDVPLFLVLGRS